MKHVFISAMQTLINVHFKLMSTKNLRWENSCLIVIMFITFFKNKEGI